MKVNLHDFINTYCKDDIPQIVIDDIETIFLKRNTEYLTLDFLVYRIHRNFESYMDELLSEVNNMKNAESMPFEKRKQLRLNITMKQKILHGFQEVLYKLNIDYEFDELYSTEQLYFYLNKYLPNSAFIPKGYCLAVLDNGFYSDTNYIVFYQIDQPVTMEEIRLFYQPYLYLHQDKTKSKITNPKRSKNIQLAQTLFLIPENQISNFLEEKKMKRFDIRQISETLTPYQHYLFAHLDESKTLFYQ